MKLTPVKRYAEPAFPTREILDRHPELLRLSPRRWQGKALVLTALTAACTIALTRWQQAAAEGTDTPASRVAPIFQHGDGRGAFGCEAVNPPVFLSEDEARQVIIEEAKRAGITFTPDSLTLKAIEIPVTSLAYEQKNPQTRTADLALDGTEAKRHISFEFVSNADFDAWTVKDGEPQESVFSKDLAGTARVLRDNLVKAQPAGAYAVFYDPGIGPMDAYENSDKKAPINWEAETQAAKMIARYELRQQVRDFITWLKAQGVI